jgi:hypothetical protein
MSDLVDLARRYVALSDQLEAVRGEIARAVLNGAGPCLSSADRPASRQAKSRTRSRSLPSNLLHSSGSPALRRPSKMGSSWARYVESSLCAVQEARRRETV